jgi:two-component system LytT family response regulator
MTPEKRPGSSRLRVLVAEDEPPARATVRELVEADPGLEWVGETWGDSTPGEIRRLQPDLLLLDVQMPGMSGLDVLESLEAEEIPAVIFVTAYDDYAVDAFEVRALDYLLKPFTDERFQEAIGRAKERLAAGDPLGGPPPAPLRGSRSGEVEKSAVDAILRDRLIIRDGNRSLVLPREQILWVEASGQYVLVHMDPEGHHLVRVALKELEERLRPWGFFRVHRSAVVNLDSVREIRSLSHGDGLLVLSEGTKVKLSRSRRQGFEAVLLDRHGPTR